MEAAKRKTFWLSLLALACVFSTPIFASSVNVLQGKTRAELSAETGQNSIERSAFYPGKHVENYDVGWGTASDSPVAPRSAADDLLPILNKQFVPRQFTAKELRGFAQAEYDRLLAAGMSRREIGPAISIAQDAKTGQLSTIFRNDLQGRLPANLSDEIANRIFTSPEYIKTRGLGSHAEIFAADELLKARPGATLSDLRIYTIETKIKGLRGQFKPPCPHCGHLLHGAEFLK